MNIKDMISTCKGGGIHIAYIRGSITYAESQDGSNVITFYDREDNCSSVDVSEFLKLDHGFQSQFGIGLTDDGTYFFLQSWSRGLFCFERKTGMLKWHCKRRMAYELVVRDATVICRFMDQCVDKFDIATGDVVAHYPLGYDTDFLPLSDEYYLVGPKRGKYHILDSDLHVVASIPYIEMNPHMYDSFIINSADIVSNGIEICGFEHTREADRNALHSNPRNLNELSERSRFTRVVKVSF